MNLLFNIYAAGTDETRKLLDQAPDFATALAAYESNPDAWMIIPVGESSELEKLGDLYGINPRYSGGCYIMRSGGGISCYGFDVLARKSAAVAKWLNYALLPTLPGSPEAYAQWQMLLKVGAARFAETGEYCPADLTPQLIGLEGKRVEVTNVRGESSRFTVGRSCGWMPVHIELNSRRSHDGPAVYDAPFADVRVIESKW